MNRTAEEISKQLDVREALDQTRGKTLKAQAKDKFWFVTHALLLVGCGVLYYLLASHFVPLPRPHVEMLLRLLSGSAMIILLLALAKAVAVYGIGRVSDASTRYTLKRVECPGRGPAYSRYRRLCIFC